MNKAPKIYCSTYCNSGHDLKTGKPVDHECRVIPPEALEAEREGRFEDAVEVMEDARVDDCLTLKEKLNHHMRQRAGVLESISRETRNG